MIVGDELSVERDYGTTSDEWELGSDKPGDPVPPGPDDVVWTLMGTVCVGPWVDSNGNAFATVVWTWKRSEK